jgi:hypothetical protein
LLFPSNIKARTKRRQIRELWQLSGHELIEEHPLLRDDVLVGIGSGGPGFNNYRPDELAYLITLSGAFKSQGETNRKGIVADYTNFMSWIESVPREDSRQFRHMLRYFAFPDQVERMSSNRDRRLVLEAFVPEKSSEIRDWTDRQLDEALLKFRRRKQILKSNSVHFVGTYSNLKRPRLRGGHSA